MSKNKQWLAAALAAVMVLGLTACGSGEEQEDPESEPAAGTAVQIQSVTLDSIATENTVSGGGGGYLHDFYFHGGQVHRGQL